MYWFWLFYLYWENSDPQWAPKDVYAAHQREVDKYSWEYVMQLMYFVK